ncbi:helix-turn-helix domain-containing protein [Pseudobacter ginsenosidimutans]|uniref:AraC-like DNA-binding protein n=1 Tax=Pseudobacter ginsenosidimutans TaxID=661488 RepID=A0A4Q7MRC2_9BACT|nr:helix-turn-helix domain-containing protein [Pseudobacter ginsenosidimutans]QEC42027.1 helix-turn-helix domain-containing protein [Pseudobacter ginsenosidimutans]RZS71137.1 AraC-like DNA-binding protein [Pseudobacter ginsenosidimutans]
MSSNTLVVKDLNELYDLMGLSHEQIDSRDGFSILYLQEIMKNLPLTSVRYRPDFFSFLFIREAFGKYTIDDLQFNMQPRTVYFTNPGNLRSFEWHQLNDTCLIVFTEAFLKEQVHSDIYNDFSFLLTETVEPRVLMPEQFRAIEELYQIIHREYSSNSPYRNKLIGSMLVSLLFKIREYFFQDYNPIYEGNRSSQIVRTFKQNLEQHFRDLAGGKTDTQLRVQDYADKQFLHVNYLSSVISSKTGKTVSAWIADKTITEAKVMLQNKQVSIKEVASRLGFLEASHFSNYFRKHTHQSPAEYRKQSVQ